MNATGDAMEPGEIEEALQKLLVASGSGSPVSAFWHLTSTHDAAEVLDMRWQQKAYLARYGRQSMLQWENEPVTKLNRATRAIGDLIREEGAMDRSMEDR